MKQLITLALILLIASVSGCYYDSEEHLYPKLSTPCEDTVVTFSGTVTSILQPCLSCHSNSSSSSDGGGVKLENYNDILFYVNNKQLMQAINHQNGYAMPQTGEKLPQCQIDQLQKWIENQTPKN